MTEKEFLKAFFEWVEETQSELNDQYDVEECIDKFLPYFHNSYYEVEFISKEKELSFGGIPIKFDSDTLNPTLILTDGKGKAIGELTEGVNTLYNQEGKVIGWSSLTQEQLMEIYKKGE